ncbi:MAG TPA: four-carbon acid sugar kinase family protein [Bryobacteraceae bacterium]|nr:four-carbon acid sugar kinase family protein [Bryobacteraceae bacterium]
MSHRLLSYYGDDFTGSTDVLEVLAVHGVPAVLFLDPPEEGQLARFPDCRAMGIAGESRSRGPEWMSAHLPAAFRSLQAFGAPVCQYKVCSTFDSSPQFGSIGRTIEIGSAVFDTECVPVVAAAPHLKRYVLFGNLFAAVGDEVYRIDRHPVMRHHPVTPMEESDLRLHLARQMKGKALLLDIRALRAGAAAQFDRLAAERPQAVVIDGLDEESLVETGRLLWQRTGRHPFLVGSSGLTNALALHWRVAGLIPQTFEPARARAVEKLIVISGSCSAVTAGQIEWAAIHGFAMQRVTPQMLADAAAREALVASGLEALANGWSLAVYTALGPGDCEGGMGGAELGCELGRLLRQLLLGSDVRRVVVAGGDTASHAVRQLGIEALTFAGPLSPGAPLCRSHAPGSAMDGLELVLKGGQVGPENFFEIALKGRQE